MAKLLIKWVQVSLLVVGLVVAEASWADDQVANSSDVKRPGYGAVIADTLLVRPITFVAMVVGSAVWVVTLPITLPTGTAVEAGATLVADPALTTFARCLGCTEVGWRKLPKKDISDQ